MDAEFWLARWTERNTPFHRSEANDKLLAHFDALALKPGARVFVPLCGKTLDIGWLLGKGCTVAGAELSPLAVEELFAELGVTADVSSVGALTRHSAPGIDIFVGDIFDLSADALGPVDAIYDRAALIALPPDMRRRYVAHLRELTGAAPQLLLTIDYDQSQMDGPPFAVSDAEVREHYSAAYDVNQLSSEDVPGGIKGITPGREQVWLLS